MSEADYMDGCHHADRWDDERRVTPTHEVVNGHRNDVQFTGSRSDCWAYKKQYGGFVRSIIND